ncbi:hypothetical protein [Falsiroseomonas sp. HW251]|uniref:hypothetical protein n=1 Tax=Falsiroseomonas sp. HW251 TaxID=3390998 RepID=UPI003D31C19B
MRVVRWLITAVSCATVTWCFILIAVTQPEVLPTLVALMAGCFLLEFLLLLRSQRKAKAAGREVESRPVVPAASRTHSQEEPEAKRA